MAGFRSVIASMKANANNENENENTKAESTKAAEHEEAEPTKAAEQHEEAQPTKAESTTVEVAEQPKAATAETTPKLTTPDHVGKIIAAVKNGVILRSELTDAEGNKFDVFTTPIDMTDNIKLVASSLKYFNAKWEYEKETGNLLRVLLPFPVLRNPEAAEAAHQARLERNKRIQERVAKREAEKAEGTKGGATKAEGTKAAEQHESEGTKAESTKAEGTNNSGTYTEEQLYKLARLVNKSISDDAIRVLIKTL